MLVALVKSPKLSSVNCWHCSEIYLCALVRISGSCLLSPTVPSECQETSMYEQYKTLCVCLQLERGKALNSPLNCWTFPVQKSQSRSSFALNLTSSQKSFWSNVSIMFLRIQEEKIQMPLNIQSWINLCPRLLFLKLLLPAILSSTV